MICIHVCKSKLINVSLSTHEALLWSVWGQHMKVSSCVLNAHDGKMNPKTVLQCQIFSVLFILYHCLRLKEFPPDHSSSRLLPWNLCVTVIHTENMKIMNATDKWNHLGFCGVPKPLFGRVFWEAVTMWWWQEMAVTITAVIWINIWLICQIITLNRFNSNEFTSLFWNRNMWSHTL